VPTTFCVSDLAALGLSKAPGSYIHEDLLNYEVGVKSRPNGWTAINMSAFYIKWNDLQQYFVLPTCGFSFTTNVGKARSYGGELELAVRPTPPLKIELAGGYTNATLTQSIASLGIHNGTLVQGVPRWNGSLAVAYERTVSQTTNAFVRVNYVYTGASHGALRASDADYNRPAYGLAGASLGIVRSRLDVEVYAKNLFNEQKIIQTPDHATVPVGFTLRPRTAGVAASYKF
jgi:iron complex outermembrane receptor protein